MNNKNLYGFTNEPTAQFSFKPPSSQRVKYESGWGAPGFNDLVNSFSAADGRTSYSTQTVHDVKITLYNNKPDDVSQSLLTGHLMFVDNQKQRPISLQYLNWMLAYETVPVKSIHEILDRFKFVGLVVAEDHDSRGNSPITHRQTFTVGIQGTFSIFNYWYQAGAKRYSDCFLVLEKGNLSKGTTHLYQPKIETKYTTDIELKDVWQIVPRAYDAGRVPKDLKNGSFYWYIGNIHEYMYVPTVPDGNSPANDYKELVEFNGGMPIQFYLNST